MRLFYFLYQINVVLTKIFYYFLSAKVELRIDKGEKSCLEDNTEVIYILTEETKDIGFIKIDIANDLAILDNIYLLPEHKSDQNVQLLLQQAKATLRDIGSRTLKYIGLLQQSELVEVLMMHGFNLNKEHIQMEKVLSSSKDLLLDSNFNVRRLLDYTDIKWVLDFMNECMGVANYSLSEIQPLISTKNDLACVIYYNTLPIAFVIAEINEKRNLQEHKSVIYLEQIAVHPAFRQQGFATKSINYIQSIGFQRGMTTARLHVYRHNTAAYNLYQKLGYIPVKSIGHWVMNIS